MKSKRSGKFSGFVLKGDHPLPHRATRLSTLSASPPHQSGRCGFCTGFGAKPTSLNETYLPSNCGESLVHSSIIAAIYSSHRRPRSWNGTLSIRYSSSSQPTPTSATARPPLSQSSVAHALACTIGFCNGSIVTEDDSLMRGAAVATNDSATTECE